MHSMTSPKKPGDWIKVTMFVGGGVCVSVYTMNH